MKGSRLHLDLFKVFSDLADCRSFSKAAGRNNLTQSAVSQQVAFLERCVGQTLIERGNGNFGLTEHGEIFLESSRKMLALFEETLDRIGRPDDIRGIVRVETIYSIGLYELSRFIRIFMKRYPGVNLHVEYNRCDRIYEAVLKGNCHLGIVAYPWGHPLLHISPFLEEKMGLICAPKHPLANRRKLRLPDLMQRKFIAFDENIPTRKAIDAILQEHEICISIVHEFDNIETLKRVVEIGVGVSIVPHSTVAAEVRNGSLRYIPFTDNDFLRPAAILQRRGHALPRAAEALARLLTA